MTKKVELQMLYKGIQVEFQVKEQYNMLLDPRHVFDWFVVGLEELEVHAMWLYFSNDMINIVLQYKAGKTTRRYRVSKALQESLNLNYTKVQDVINYRDLTQIKLIPMGNVLE